ncbi:MAG: hypothetical protein IPN58_04420, partial [Anaerolineales bacterium]|nr:hypothetical protein [Anaerolineales bacterium]
MESDNEDEKEDDEQEVAIEPVQWLDYDQIVQPHKQVVVKGYLRRLGMEIGPKAIWLYIGFLTRLPGEFMRAEKIQHGITATVMSCDSA